jgi:hypothetical protein
VTGPIQFLRGILFVLLSMAPDSIPRTYFFRGLPLCPLLGGTAIRIRARCGGAMAAPTDRPNKRWHLPKKGHIKPTKISHYEHGLEEPIWRSAVWLCSMKVRPDRHTSARPPFARRKTHVKTKQKKIRSCHRRHPVCSCHILSNTYIYVWCCCIVRPAYARYIQRGRCPWAFHAPTTGE